ncbi:MAG: mdcB [Firmicutes bacterium]|nr:mdcB [Bacillota bacterium]
MSGTGRRITWAAGAACMLEATAEKPGNVTPTRAFKDMTYSDFVLSSLVLGPVMGQAGRLPVGELILQAVQATRAVTPANTNLGIALLLAPLARAYALGEAAAADGLAAGTRAVLQELTVADARAAYTAIRLANPGGLGRVKEQDVHDEPTVTLLAAMAAAAGRDLVAAQYAGGYGSVFQVGLPALLGTLERGAAVPEAVVQTFLTLLVAAPDTLIARKLGPEAAEAVTTLAGAALAAGGVLTAAGRREIALLDDHLRDGHNRWNPGTTADLTAAVLFAALLLRGPDLLSRRSGGGGDADPGL